jgi:hypothetical protein
VHADATLGEGQCDPPRADAKLERSTAAREAGQEINHRIDRLGFEHVRSVLLVSRRDPLVEKTVVFHRQSLVPVVDSGGKMARATRVGHREPVAERPGRPSVVKAIGCIA